ncbi:hypothetical protein HK104_003569 [Borealophlyctis nickersoniae]|nr:hypothetical protein HK104_003569 [Borealophlyctis nickersoniae]
MPPRKSTPILGFDDLAVGSIYKARVAVNDGQNSSSHSVLICSKCHTSASVTICLFASFNDDTKSFSDIELPPEIPDHATLGKLLLPASPITINPYRPDDMLLVTPPFKPPPTNSFLILMPRVTQPTRAKVRRLREPPHTVSEQELEKIVNLLQSLRKERGEAEVEDSDEEAAEDGAVGVGPEECGGWEEDSDGENPISTILRWPTPILMEFYEYDGVETSDADGVWDTLRTLDVQFTRLEFFHC